jgi:hypothetical protein
MNEDIKNGLAFVEDTFSNLSLRVKRSNLPTYEKKTLNTFKSITRIASLCSQ